MTTAPTPISTPRHITVEGPIGVGKTTLVQKLAEALGAHTLLEQPDENPFLERFYHDPKRQALPAQLFFLFQRARQLEELRQRDMFAPTTVADFMMEKDPLFARLNLDSDELRLYEQIYAQLKLRAPTPDLVILLQAPVEVLSERVRRRNRSVESLLSRDYLARVNEAYTQFFYYYDAAPLLIVNSAQLDLTNNPGQFAALLSQVESIRSGRHFFNPAPAA